jgi:hypothetical protein
LGEKHADVLQSIRDTNALSDDNSKALVVAIEEFNKTF